MHDTRHLISQLMDALGEGIQLGISRRLAEFARYKDLRSGAFLDGKQCVGARLGFRAFYHLQFTVYDDRMKSVRRLRA